MLKKLLLFGVEIDDRDSVGVVYLDDVEHVLCLTLSQLIIEKFVDMLYELVRHAIEVLVLSSYFRLASKFVHFYFAVSVD